MRLFNRLLVFALGIVFIALGFIAAVEAIWTGLGYRFLWFPGREWLHTLRTTPWSARTVLDGAAIVTVVALMMLIAENLTMAPAPRTDPRRSGRHMASRSTLHRAPCGPKPGGHRAQDADQDPPRHRRSSLEAFFEPTQQQLLGPHSRQRDKTSLKSLVLRQDP